jgi:hypothetical protein
MHSFRSTLGDDSQQNTNIATNTAENHSTEDIGTSRQSLDGSSSKPTTIPWASVRPRVHSVSADSLLLPGAVQPQIPEYFNSRNPVCMCGKPWRSHSKHAQDAYTEGATEWSTELDTEPVPTDTFGEVEFVGFGQKISKVGNCYDMN